MIDFKELDHLQVTDAYVMRVALDKPSYSWEINHIKVMAQNNAHGTMLYRVSNHTYKHMELNEIPHCDEKIFVGSDVIEYFLDEMEAYETLRKHIRDQKSRAVNQYDDILHKVQRKMDDKFGTEIEKPTQPNREIELDEILKGN